MLSRRNWFNRFWLFRESGKVELSLHFYFWIFAFIYMMLGLFYPSLTSEDFIGGWLILLGAPFIAFFHPVHEVLEPISGVLAPYLTILFIAAVFSISVWLISKLLRFALRGL